MFQVHSSSKSSLTVPPTSFIEEVVEEYTLSFDPTTGQFKLLDSTGHLLTLDTTGIFPIFLSAGTTKIIIKLNGITLDPLIESQPSTAIRDLPLNTEAVITSDASETQITITAPSLTSILDIIGFVIFVQRPEESVRKIQTPPFLFVNSQSFPKDIHLQLTYDTSESIFKLEEVRTAGPTVNGATRLLRSLELPKGFVIPRLSRDASLIRVTLASSSGEEILFAEDPAVFSTGSGAQIIQKGLTEFTLRRNFTSDSAFCMSFKVKFRGCTICSPDPIIVDKQIGGPD